MRPCWLLHGEETFLVDRALALLRSRLVPADRSGSWRVLWADDDGNRLAAALADLRSPPLFGGREVVVVRHAEALDEAGQDRVLATLPALEAGGHVVLVGGAVDVRRRLFATCVRAGAAYGFPPIIDARVRREWAGRFARERGCQIAPAALDELLERGGEDLAQLASEIEKLALHVGARARIEPADVRAVTAGVRARAIQELTDRIARRDFAGAVRTLRELLVAGEPPIRAVAFIAANLRRALHVAECAEAGLDAAEIARRLSMPEWLVARQLGRGRAGALAAALAALRHADLELKSSRPVSAVLEAALFEITS